MITEPEVERYAVGHTTPPSDAVAALRAETQATMPMPQMAGGEAEVRLLEALVVAGRATRVLEIGTFTGVTSLSLAACLPEGGRITTIERDEAVAAVARRHFDASSFGDRIELLVGDARELVGTLEGPFDLIWIDAWKPDYPHYLQAVLPLLAPRGVVAADNVLLGGRVLADPPPDEGAEAMRAFTAVVLADPELHSVVLTVGDGVLLAWRAPGR